MGIDTNEILRKLESYKAKQSPIITHSTLVNQNLASTTEKVVKFLKGAGLGLSTNNISKYFSSKYKESVDGRTLSEIYHRIVESKHMEPIQKKRGDEFVKKVEKDEKKRFRVLGKSKFKRSN